MAKSKIVLLSKVLSHMAPRMLVIGRINKRSVKGEKLFPVTFLGGSLWLFLKSMMKMLVNVRIFRDVKRGVEESGLGTPSKRHVSFTKSPAKIKKATLKPTENRMTSIFSSPFGFIN
jgi:hypothetical protein